MVTEPRQLCCAKKSTHPKEDNDMKTTDQAPHPTQNQTAAPDTRHSHPDYVIPASTPPPSAMPKHPAFRLLAMAYVKTEASRFLAFQPVPSIKFQTTPHRLKPHPTPYQSSMSINVSASRSGPRPRLS